jgi:hypothetical protein
MKNKNAFIFLPWVIGIAVVSVGVLTVNYVRLLGEYKKVVAPKEVVQTTESKVASLPNEASIYLEADSEEFQVAKRQLVKLIVDTTESDRKVDFLETKICWNKESLKIADEKKDIVLGNDGSFSGIVMTEVADEGDNTCARIYTKSEKTSSELMSGKLEALNIYFTGVTEGQGSLIIDTNETKLSGPPVEENRYKVGIGKIGEFSYSVNP